MYICTKQGSFTIQAACPAVSNFRRSRWKILVWWVDGWMDTVVSFLTRNGSEQRHHPLRESVQSAKCPKLPIALAGSSDESVTGSRAGSAFRTFFPSPAHCIRGVAVPRGWTETVRRGKGTVCTVQYGYGVRRCSASALRQCTEVDGHGCSV